jgi:hypothetical protein
MLELLPATQEHAKLVAARVRKADADEMQALGFPDPLHGITDSISASVNALYVACAGAPMGIFGYAAPSLIGRGCEPWLITTDEVERHPIAFARASRRVLPLMRAELGGLTNVVDVRHTVCIRWLKWLGFTVHEAVALPPYGHLFHPFEMKGAY